MCVRVCVHMCACHLFIENTYTLTKRTMRSLMSIVSRLKITVLAYKLISWTVWPLSIIKQLLEVLLGKNSFQ